MTPAPPSRTLCADGIRLTTISTGAAVAGLRLEDSEGGWTDVVLGHADRRSYRHGGYLGAVIGRVGNRIDRGRFELDGATHQVSVDERGNALHGGVEGFDLREWELVDAAADHVTWGLVSPAGDQGFPGEVRVQVRYRLSPGEVRLDYSATTTAPTPLNLTHHAYFNLDGESSGTIREHRLQVEADTFIPTRPDQIPTGEVREVAGTAFDLRQPTPLAAPLSAADEQVRIAGGIDHHFVVRGEGMRRHATLVGGSGRRLEVWSDRPGVQVYTGDHFDGTITGISGSAYHREAGVALETQGPPDAINQPGFPSPVLRPGETFRSWTVWRVGTSDPI
ncbi:aldose epimerase family protein [Serinicoccus kebangsaanensis]|uniref:aldose epimerase family protein n=1 Tax=Serinicoccus kebangsaanensis TaxID=2602069 RepID=UPI00124F7697|nr:aldose epimerase family protein [Serinicoccus kebangsaanensis]